MNKHRGKKQRGRKQDRRIVLPVIPPYAREELEERWRKAGIENDYIFSVVMKDPGIFLQLMQRILPELHLTHVVRHEQQKSQYGAPDAKSVRYDVYSEIDGFHFVVEMQMLNLPDLRRRTRYYQSMIDIQNLDRGARYRDLPDSFVIMICPFDLFGKGRHLYRFRNIDIHDHSLELGDGAEKIFLNTKGTENDIEQDLKNFLELVNGRAPADSYCRQVADSVDAAKRSVEVKRMFMNVNIKQMAEREYYAREARAKGLAEGLAQGLAEGRAEGLAKGHAEGLAEGRAEEQENSLRLILQSVIDGDLPITVAVKLTAAYGITSEADLRHRASELGIQLPE